MSDHKRYLRFTRQAQAARDNGYCGVAALAMTMFRSYNSAYELAARVFGRRHGEGTALHNAACWARFNETTDHTARCIFTRDGSMYGDALRYGKRYADGFEVADLSSRGFTLASVAKRYPKGKYIVLIDRHAVAFKDGVCMDWTDAHLKSEFTYRNYSKKRVHAVIEITKDQ